MTLGLVWTPCAGPVLASILTLIALQKDLLAAAILLLFYSIGVGVPMLIIAYGGQYISEKVQVISKYSVLLQQIFGVIIILLAIAMFFNYDTKLYSFIFQYFPALNPQLNMNKKIYIYILIAVVLIILASIYVDQNTKIHISNSAPTQTQKIKVIQNSN